MHARRIAIVVLLIIAATEAAAEFHIARRHVTRPHVRCSIPDADYQYRYNHRSQSVFAISLRRVSLDNAAVEVERVVSANTTRTEAEIRAALRTDGILFQWDAPTLIIDHCSISQPALQLYRNGDWVLSLRADQNPRSDNVGETTYRATEHIKRNRFAVRLRCYGRFTTEPTEDAVQNGKPVLVEITPAEFWVQNGEPRFLRADGNDDLIIRHFDDIDRVELEFFYYKGTAVQD